MKLAETYQAVGDLKAAVGIYKKARAAYFIAACVNPMYYRQVTAIDSAIEDLLRVKSSRHTQHETT